MQKRRVNASFRLYLTILHSVSTVSPESFAAGPAAPNAAPNAAARDIALVPRSTKIHHAALRHRSGTPLYTLRTNLPSREFTVHCISWIAETFLNRVTSDALTHALSRDEVSAVNHDCYIGTRLSRAYEVEDRFGCGLCLEENRAN